ncbi:hypothetical protein IPN35_03150 [Candidatus Peregrinibacteria bacterium]|nr:MAG: hypothetical protein IPN35_03150 [Candidatus Peregrinibacteria bacterium]
MREHFQEFKNRDQKYILREMLKYDKERIEMAYKTLSGNTEIRGSRLSPEILEILKNRRKELQNIWEDDEFPAREPVCNDVEKGMEVALQMEKIAIILEPIVFLTDKMNFNEDRVNAYCYNHRPHNTQEEWCKNIISRAVLADSAVLKNGSPFRVGDTKNGVILDSDLPKAVVRFVGLGAERRNQNKYAFPFVARNFRNPSLADEIKKYMEEKGYPFPLFPPPSFFS